MSDFVNHRKLIQKEKINKNKIAFPKLTSWLQTIIFEQSSAVIEINADLQLEKK